MRKKPAPLARKAHGKKGTRHKVQGTRKAQGKKGTRDKKGPRIEVPEGK